MPGGFGNRKYFLVLRHSTINMLLTAEMPFKRVCRNGRRAQGSVYYLASAQAVIC